VTPTSQTGAGGAGATGCTEASRGSQSIFGDITSTGGGRGGGQSPCSTLGQPGGSGGGSYSNQTVSGSGNTPPVSPPQGNPGTTASSGAPGYGGRCWGVSSGLRRTHGMCVYVCVYSNNTAAVRIFLIFTYISHIILIITLCIFHKYLIYSKYNK
jgi:hypothetical protein